MALKEAGKWFSGRVQEQRSMSALDQLLVRFVKEEIHPFLFNSYALITFQKSGWSLEMEKIEMSDNQCTSSNRSLS